MDKRWGGEYQDFPSKFLSHSAENFRRGEPFNASLISGTEKVWIRGGEGEYQDFPSQFLSHCTETFHWKTLGVVSEKFFYRKFLCIGGAGGITVLSELFVSQHRNEKLCKGTLVFRKFSGIEKELWIRGGISRFSVEIFMSHTAENFRKGILLFLRKFLLQKVLWMKNFVGIPSMFQKNWGIEKFYA